MKSGNCNDVELTRKYENAKFSHIPKLYKDAAKIINKYCNKEGTIRTLIYSPKHRVFIQSDIKRLYAVVSKVVDLYSDIENALNAVKLFDEHPDFDRSLAFVLTSEILRKNCSLFGNSKPVEVIKSYEKQLRDILKDCVRNEKKIVDYKEVFPKYVRINTYVESEKDVHTQFKNLGWKLLNFNQQQTSYDDFLSSLKSLDGNSYMKDYHIPNLLIFPSQQEFTQLDVYRNCSIILHDKASCLPAFLSNVQPGDTVIDACAAPGNKLSHLAALMEGKGRLLAIDRNYKRYKTMVRLLSVRGFFWIETMNCDFTSCNPSDYPDVKVILVDPFCFSETNSHGLSHSANSPIKALQHALSFPNVETVVYSTSSIHEEEKEQVVEKILEEFASTFHLEDLSQSLLGWKHFGSSEYDFGHLCVRTNSSIDKCRGSFVAKFVRTNLKSISNKKNKSKRVHQMEDQNVQKKKIKR